MRRAQGFAQTAIRGSARSSPVKVPVRRHSPHPFDAYGKRLDGPAPLGNFSHRLPRIQDTGSFRHRDMHVSTFRSPTHSVASQPDHTHHRCTEIAV